LASKLSRKQFPSSIRVEKLKGIHCESCKKYDDAEKIYKKILAEKPEDTVVRKRMIVMQKQRGKTQEAIADLVAYLDSFSVDPEVWHELAELYIDVGALTRAAFCFEELMLSNPRSMYHILTYAELLYSAGEIEQSRKYFSLGAYLDGTCLRALWGLYMCNMALAEKEKNKDPSASARMEELQAQTVQKIRGIYKGISGAHGKLAIGLLASDS